MIPHRVAALAVAVLVLGGAGLAAAVTRDDDGDTEAAAVTTTSIFLADITTTTPDAATTTAAGATSTTARGAATTTTARAGTTTTTRPATTTTTAAPNADCTSAMIEVTATTDQRSYRPDQQVKVDSTLRNRSQTTCFYAGQTFQVAIQDAVGRTIITFEIATPAGATKSSFVPGATLTGSVPWDQRSCQTQPCPQPPPGPYSAAVKWTFAGGPYEARAAFTLTA